MEMKEQAMWIAGERAFQRQETESAKVRSKAHADRVEEQQGPQGQSRGRKGER